MLFYVDFISIFVFIDFIQHGELWCYHCNDNGNMNLRGDVINSGSTSQNY
jgi:hypothetical protein